MPFDRYPEAIRAKVSCARQEASALQGTIEDFGAKLRKDVVRGGDDGGGRSIWVFRGPTPEIPVAWSVRVGEFLHNLRSCLNYIAFQSILDSGRQPTRRTAFPMASSREEWDCEARRRVGSASEEDKRLMEYFQTYTGGLNLDCDVSFLQEIVELSNQDRHRSPVSIEVCWSFNTKPLNRLCEDVPSISLDVRPVPSQIKSGQVVLDINSDISRYVDVQECFQTQFYVGGDARDRKFLPLGYFLEECLRYVNELLRVRDLPQYGGIARHGD